MGNIKWYFIILEQIFGDGCGKETKKRDRRKKLLKIKEAFQVWWRGPCHKCYKPAVRGQYYCLKCMRILTDKHFPKNRRNRPQ